MNDIFEIAKNGLLAQQKGMDVTGHNISNAATPGYSRQRADMEALAYQKGLQHVGLGARVEDVERLRSEFIDQQIRQKQSDESGLKAEKQMLQQIESVFATSSDGDLNNLINNFFDSFLQLSSNPEDSSLRQDVVNNAEAMTSRMSEMNSQLQSIQESIGDQSREAVDKVNRLLREIGSLDREITSNEGEGQQSNNQALDQRTRKLEELSNLVDLNTTQDENKSLTLRIGGIVVLQNGQSQELQTELNAANDVNRVRLPNGKVINEVGGELGSLQNTYSKQIPEFREGLDKIAETLVNEVNSLHSQGYGLDNSTGINFFSEGGSDSSSIEVNSVVKNNLDKIAASDQNNAPGNSNNADAIAALRDQKVIDDYSLSNYSVNLGAQAGNRIQEIDTTLETTRASKEMLNNQQESISGVNLDEELTNLIKFQNAYQASARVLNAGQRMFDSLLSIV